ncbi:hypothetical protein ACHWQZ_G001478 [Mnemiopsis leidyi]
MTLFNWPSKVDVIKHQEFAYCTGNIDIETMLGFNPTTKQFQCTLCGKETKSSGKLREHVKIVHLKLRPYKCDYCDMCFGTTGNRKSHMRMRHLNLVPTMKCDFCDAMFKTVKQEKGITKQHHTAGATELQSTTATKGFTKCPHCAKYVKGSAWKLSQHINMVHLKLRPFQCEYCELKFGSACNKKAHMKRKHGVIG